jgi:hypothetical protein
MHVLFTMYDCRLVSDPEWEEDEETGSMQKKKWRRSKQAKERHRETDKLRALRIEEKAKNDLDTLGELQKDLADAIKRLDDLKASPFI